MALEGSDESPAARTAEASERWLLRVGGLSALALLMTLWFGLVGRWCPR